MARNKTMPRRRAKGGKKIYTIKRRQVNPKSVRFGNTQFTGRYDGTGKKHVRR